MLGWGGVGVGVGMGGGELWLTDSSWLLGCHGQHEFPRDRSWHHTLVAQSLINLPMPGSVIYKYTIQKCDRMDEDANSPSESNWQCEFLHTSFMQ